MKKQISVLAGSMLAAAGSQALVVGGDVLAVFNTAGAGSFYQVVDTTASLLSGDGFSVDVSAAAAALGGSIESFALIAIAGDQQVGGLTNGSYNYTEFVYVLNDGGLVTAGGVADAGASSNAVAQNRIFQIEAFLENATLGLNGEGTLGDFDAASAVASLLTSGATTVVLNAQNGGQVDSSGSTTPTTLDITAPSGLGGLVLDGTTFSATGVSTVIPVPAAAWLFGSALLGLGVVRRK